MTTSGTTVYNPFLSDLAIECFDRLQIRSAAITSDHMQSFRRSANLIQARWSNRVPNLWLVDLQSVPLVQGQQTYILPEDTISVLDVYLRLYQLASPVSLAPAFSTTMGSATVEIAQAGSGIAAGNWLQVIVPVAVGGIVLQGYYEAVSVTGSDTYTITAASPALSTDTAAGSVPVFTSAATTTAVSVELVNHGYLAGQSFTVQVATSVGGVTLQGAYPIATITDADNFIITIPYMAGSTQTVSENGGETQIAVQQMSANPTDRMLYPLSRDDYAAIPNKTQQGVPTSYWFNRTTTPSMTIWNVPDGNGPYALQYYRMRQMQDAEAVNGLKAEMPYRFLEAYCAEVAAHLAIKWKPEAAVALVAYAKDAWLEASTQDREVVPLRMMPDYTGYYS